MRFHMQIYVEMKRCENDDDDDNDNDDTERNLVLPMENAFSTHFRARLHRD